MTRRVVLAAARASSARDVLASMADDFAKKVRELWTQAEEADKDNRAEALTDLEFAAPDETAGHWDPQVKRYREQMGIERYGFPLPCLTINTVPQFVGQVIGIAGPTRPRSRCCPAKTAM
jgi:hypothetical protein